MVDFRGTAGADTLTGGIEDDSIWGLGGDDILFGLEGDDRLDGGGGDDTLRGGVGADTLFGGLGNDVLDGGSGSDMAAYTGLGGGVTVDLSLTGPQQTGAGGIDTLISIENLYGSGYDDVLRGNAGANRLIGDAGHDQLFGGGGNDQLNGGAGDDFLDGGTGNDTLDGGAGFDTVSYAGREAGISVTLDLNLDNGKSVLSLPTGKETDQLLGIEKIIGTDFADYIVAKNVDAGAGDDVIRSSNPDGKPGGTLLGGDGNDDIDVYNAVLVDAGAGDDIVQARKVGMIDGGAGIDTLYYDRGGSVTWNDPVTFSLFGATELPDGSGLRNFERLKYYGGGGVDDITGANDADILLGRTGNDILRGLGGDDRLEGEYGDDSLVGGSGNDLLAGGRGNDRLSGGAGADIFQFSRFDDGADRIVDFNPAEDRLWLDTAGFTAISAAFDYDGDHLADDVTLTHAGGTVTIINGSGLGLADYNALLYHP